MNIHEFAKLAEMSRRHRYHPRFSARAVADVLTQWLDNGPLIPAVTGPYQLISRESVK